MSINLVVVRSFSGRARGDAFADASRVAAVLNSEHAVNVVRVIASMEKG